MALDFDQFAADAFAAAGAVTETYTPAGGGAPVEVQVLFERGVVRKAGPVSHLVDKRTRAHLLVAEVGRPAKGSTITDGEETRRIDVVESDDGSVVVCVVS